jgi:hypothetical protein
MVEPLTGPVGPATPICVRLYNGGVREATGTVDVAVPGWTVKPAVPFDVKPGKFAVVSVPVSSAAPNAQNVYDTAVKVSTNGAGAPITLKQPFQAAYMTRLSPNIDGDLSDWKGHTPVTLATYEKGLDWGALALNPALFNQARADGKPPIQNALLRLYTAYDSAYLYVAYELTGKKSAADWVQLGLGLTDWSARNVRAKDDPWAYKGHFYDNDYVFALNDPAGQIWRLGAPDARWRTPYNWIIQCKGGDASKFPRFVSDPDYEASKFYDIVAKGGAKIAATDDGNGRRTVECAIPRSLIPEFQPIPGKPVRLSFILHQGASLDGTTYYEWSKVAGEFPFLKGFGSFQPSWQMLYPNQLSWGVE